MPQHRSDTPRQRAGGPQPRTQPLPARAPGGRRRRRTGAPPAWLVLLLAAPATPAALAAPGDAGADAEPTRAAAAPGLELSACRISDEVGLRSHEARCGRLSRPLNPDDPGGEQIELFVAVVPALSPAPADSALTVIAGGPGGASTAFYAGFADAFGAVRRQRDIVLVDQRGTGRSHPLRCDFSDLDVATVTPEESARAARDCLEGLDLDPRYFTTSVAVADLEAVRAALGYARLDVYGASYGTRVALHFLRRYPASTRTLILDGVVPAQVPIAPEIAVDAQAALDAVFSRCAADAGCSKAFPSLAERFAAVQARLAEGPVSVALLDPYTGEPANTTVGETELRAAVRLLSYNPYSVSLLPLLISAAADGNFQPLAAQAQMVIASLDEALSYGMHNAVVCTEDAPFFDAFVERELGGRDAERASYLGVQQLDTLKRICEVWPAGVIDEDFKEPVRSATPVLVLSGDADPVTPPRNGERAIGPDGAYLSNARHVVAPGQGHGVANVGCLPRLVGEFVDSADVHALDTTCVERLGPAAFFVDFSATAP